MRVNLTVPVYNEELSLPRAVERLVPFLSQTLPGCCELVIAENGSTDRTLEVARVLCRRYPQVRVLEVQGQGRGRALKQAWEQSEAEVVSYMDVDLSTELSYFPHLIEPLLQGRYDLAAGSRLLRPEWTRRGWKREWLSRGYNRLVKLVFANGFSDAQCGFKALTRRAAAQLLPRIEDTGWFFDTELLLVAERLGLRILDLPVRWQDDPDSRVRIVRTVLQDLRGLARMRSRFRRDEP